MTAWWACVCGYFNTRKRVWLKHHLVTDGWLICPQPNAIFQSTSWLFLSPCWNVKLIFFLLSLSLLSPFLPTLFSYLCSHEWSNSRNIHFKETTELCHENHSPSNFVSVDQRRRRRRRTIRTKDSSSWLLSVFGLCFPYLTNRYTKVPIKRLKNSRLLLGRCYEQVIWERKEKSQQESHLLNDQFCQEKRKKS